MDIKPFIKGLKYRDAVSKKVGKDGKNVMQHTPTERPLTEDDVLSHRDYGTYVNIVTRDGRRYRVEKKAAPAKKASAAKKDDLYPREKTLLENGMNATKKGYSYKKIFIHKEKLLAVTDGEFQEFLDALAKEQDDDQNNQ